jgi:hypothetical protein
MDIINLLNQSKSFITKLIEGIDIDDEELCEGHRKISVIVKKDSEFAKACTKNQMLCRVRSDYFGTIPNNVLVDIDFAVYFRDTFNAKTFQSVRIQKEIYKFMVKDQYVSFV